MVPQTPLCACRGVCSTKCKCSKCFFSIELINGDILYQRVMAIDNIIISSIHRQIMHVDMQMFKVGCTLHAMSTYIQVNK